MNNKRSYGELPQKLKEILQQQEFLCGNVLIFAEADMDICCEFRHHALILTDSRLIVGVSRKVTEELIRTKSKPKHDWQSFDFKAYELNQLKNPGTDSLVVGGIFRVEIDGMETSLCAYTNAFTGRVSRLCEVLRLLIDGKEIPEEKLSEEKRIEICPKCGKKYPGERQVCPKCMDKRKMFFRLGSFFKPYWASITVMCVMSILTALVASVLPVLSGSLLYDGILARDRTVSVLKQLPAYDFTLLLALLALTMAACRLLQQFFNVVQGRMVAKVVPEAVSTVKKKVFSSIQSLSVSFFTNKRTGGLMTRITGDANQISDMFIDVIPQVLPNLFTMIFSFVVMFSTNWVLALTAVASLPIAAVISVWLQPIMWHYNSKQHQTNRDYRARVNDSLTGARVVRAFGMEENEAKAISRENDNMYDAMDKSMKFDIKFSALYELTKSLTALLIWGIGVCFVLGVFEPQMNYGTLITFTGYVSLLAGPANFFSHIFRTWSSTMNAAQRIFEIMDAKPDVVETVTPVRMGDIKGEVELKNVTFSYEQNREVLKDVSLHVKPGKVLGIVGKSGAGKSTLANLVTRLYDPNEGHIYIDGIDIKDMSFNDIRKAVALVSQETYIFKGTIFENIAYAVPSADRKTVIEAAMAASAHDFICKLPDGYDTYVGAGGRSLSGGEKQRISIARAILANPKILILDEATAAVDTETERNIQKSLQRLIKNRTTLSIAHRISTLRNADELIVIDDGKIVEQGTHDQLIHKKGVYFKLVQIQSQALKMRGIGE